MNGDTSTIPMYDPNGVLRNIPVDQVSQAEASGATHVVPMNTPDGAKRWIPANQFHAAQGSNATVAIDDVINHVSKLPAPFGGLQTPSTPSLSIGPPAVQPLPDQGTRAFREQREQRYGAPLAITPTGAQPVPEGRTLAPPAQPSWLPPQTTMPNPLATGVTAQHQAVPQDPSQSALQGIGKWAIDEANQINPSQHPHLAFAGDMAAVLANLGEGMATPANVYTMTGLAMTPEVGVPALIARGAVAGMSAAQIWQGANQLSEAFNQYSQGNYREGRRLLMGGGASSVLGLAGMTYGAGGLEAVREGAGITPEFQRVAPYGAGVTPPEQRGFWGQLAASESGELDLDKVRQAAGTGINLFLDPVKHQGLINTAQYHLDNLGIPYSFQGSFEPWARQMEGSLGSGIEPYLASGYIRATEPYAKMVSESYPQGATRQFDPLQSAQGVTRNFLFQQTPEAAAQIANEFKNMPGLALPPGVTSTQGILDAVHDHIVGNRLWEFYKIPASSAHPNGDLLNRITNQEWYNGYRHIAGQDALKYGLDDLPATAGIASQSPGTRWDMNLEQDHRILRGFYEDRDSLWTPGMSRLVDRGIPDIAEAQRDKIPGGVLRAIRGSRLSDLTDPEQMTWWIRLHDIAEHPQFNVMQYSPRGEPLGYLINRDGTMAKMNWGMVDKNVTLTELLQNPTWENINKALGTGYKVRSFNNNGSQPNFTGYGSIWAIPTTIDTHEVAGSWLLPLQQTHPLVSANFSHSPGSFDVTGVGGPYSIYADGLRGAAQELGMLPNHLQSVLWEGTRILFPSEFRRVPDNLTSVKNIWGQVDRGILTKDQAREQIFDLAGGWNKPKPTYTWNLVNGGYSAK